MGTYETNLKNFMSPFNDVLTIISEKKEKALRQAFYNTIAIIFVTFVLAFVVAVYFVLEPFLQPLIWSFLFGSALHPFKRKLTHFVRVWLTNQTKKPFTLFAMVLPFTVFNYIINSTAKVVIQYYKLLLFIFVALFLTHLGSFYFTITHKLINFFSILINVGFKLFFTFLNICNIYISLTLLVVQLILHCFFSSQINKRISSSIVSSLLFSLIIIKLLLSFGTLGLIIFCLLLIITLSGLIATLIGRKDKSQDDKNSVQLISFKFYQSLSLFCNSFLSILLSHPSNETEKESIENDEELSGSIVTSKGDICDVTPVSSLKASSLSYKPNPVKKIKKKENHLSNSYFYALLWSCLLAQVWLRPSLLYLILLPIAVFFIKWVGSQINQYAYVSNILNRATKNIYLQLSSLVHPIFFTFYKYFCIGDELIIESLLGSIDAFCSLVTIFVMIVTFLFAVIFLAIQIYQESIYLVEIMSNVVNSTLVNNPQLANHFSSDLFGPKIFDDMVNKAYVYGREWLQNSIKKSLPISQEDSYNATKTVENQLLEIWDRVYHQWLIRNHNNSHQIQSFEAYQWDRLLAAFQTLNFTLCFNLFKENLDTFLSVFESIWLLLKGNVSLLFSTLTALFSLLLSGSSALFNCCLNLIVFFTSLFYLLCSSGDQYKPVELADRFMPSNSGNIKSKNDMNKFGQAVEESINSVFAASFKMTAFYGLYTWLIHTLFEVRIVYIPSVLAALLGAVPFIGAYWASVAAVLELWLIDHLNGKALLMLFFAFLPSYFVDSTIYSEIKGGGHPYLTGLAIAGGVFYLGFSGALFGPILLCCLFVAAKLYSSIVQGQVEEEANVCKKNKSHLKRFQTSMDL